MACVVVNSIGCCVWWYACSLCTVWLLSPLPSFQCFFCYALVCLVPLFLFVICFICFLALFILSHVILHGFFLLFISFLLILHGVYIMGAIGCILVGGSYSSVYVPPPVCVFPVALVVCIPTFFSFYSCFVLCAYFLIHIPPLFFLLPLCVSFIHAWMKTFGGCMHMHFIICSYMCVLKYVYLTYFIIFDVIGQDM